jgi:hypothetical protein
MAKKETIKEKIKKLPKKELAKGIVVEKEHSQSGPGGKELDVTHGDPKKTKKIAEAHLLEKKDYYTALAKMEKTPNKKTKPRTVKKGK